VNYVIRCLNCKQQSILELPQTLPDNLGPETLCPICGAGGKDLEVVDSVENMLPSLEAISQAMALHS